ncbi:MAG: zinc ribbon domain-containing protein [Bacillota bacterium]
MFAEALLTLDEREKSLQLLRNNLEEVLHDQELKRFKDEYQRLKGLLEKSEEKLHSINAQIDIKKNEISNLQLEKESFEIITRSDEVSHKKQEKLLTQVKKLNEKLSSNKMQMTKLNEEGENINKEILDHKKRLHFIKKKYMELKSKKEEYVENVRKQEEAFEDEINSLKASLGAELLDLYYKVKRMHQNPISFVEDRKCTGCNMEVSSMNYESAKFTQTIVRCENCGRILMYK